jgi:hypothetical protein
VLHATVPSYTCNQGYKHSSHVLTAVWQCRNVFYKKAKTRPQTPNISRQYIISLARFEFGPLLTGKDPAAADSGAHPEHMAKLRITNNGYFDLHATISLKSALEGSETPARSLKTQASIKPPPPKGKGQAGAGAAPVLPTNPFLLRPDSMELKVDETQELVVYAFPAAEEDYEDAIVIQCALALCAVAGFHCGLQLCCVAMVAVASSPNCSAVQVLHKYKILCCSCVTLQAPNFPSLFQQLFVDFSFCGQHCLNAPGNLPPSIQHL